MSELTHAELPWSHSIEDGTIESASGYTVACIIPHANINTVARTGQTHSHADAELIVRAVNAHDELVAALAELLAMCERQRDFNDDGDGKMFDRARAAITKATGGAT